MKTDIDIVITWVNDHDTVWQKKREKAIKNCHCAKTEDGNTNARFENHDEIKFALRSIEKYLPWVRYIYLLTDHQKPKWLNTNNPKIKVISHEEILPKEVKRPVYNSLLLEFFLDKIPNLSDSFIYMNDDFIINRPLRQEDFFNDQDQPIIYTTNPTQSAINLNNLPKIKTDIFNKSAVNKINQYFLKKPDFGTPFYYNTVDLFRLENPSYDYQFYLKHVPYSFNKKYFSQIRAKYSNYIENMYSNQFRAKNDIFPAMIIALNAHINKTAQFSTNNDDHFEFALGEDTYVQDIKDCKEILSDKYKFISISQGKSAKVDYINEAIKTLETKFPQKSKFETNIISLLASPFLKFFSKNKN